MGASLSGDGAGQVGDDGQGHGDAPGSHVMVDTVDADPNVTVCVIRWPDHT